MLKTNLKLRRAVMGRIMAMRVTALAFSITCVWTQWASAATNWVDGTAYGTNYSMLATNPVISTVTDGNGSLVIGYTGTTNLNINHEITGYIVVTNQANTFTIDASGASVSGSQYAVLAVLGGSNLTVNGGSFIGTNGAAGIILPPIPNQGPQTNLVSSAAMGGMIYGVTNAGIVNSTFSGASYTPDNQSSIGTDGLTLIESSMVVISNGTVTGGNGDSIGTGTSLGGYALYVDRTDVEIDGGQYTGGSAGTANLSLGGNALFATNSSVIIGGNAELTGGTNVAALDLRNTDLELNSGTIQGGAYGANKYFGLVSVVDAGKTNQIALNGGTINSIDFAGDGAQNVTVGTGLTIEDYVIIDGGSIVVTNLSNASLQHTLVRDGDIAFVNDLALLSGGDFSLDSTTSHAMFSALDVSSNAVLWVGPGTIDVAGGFSLAGGGTMLFTIVTNSYGTLTADTALFETNATLQVNATAAAFALGTNDFELVTTLNGISVVTAANSTNAATASNIEGNLNIETFTAGRTGLLEILSDGGSNLVFRFATLSLSDYWGATGQLDDLANELEGNTQMALLIDQFDDPVASAHAIEQTYFTTFNNFQTALQGMRGAVGPSISRGSEFREQLKLIPRVQRLFPRGARGPSQQNDLRGWVKYYGHYMTHDKDGLNPEYDSRQNGGTVGIDTSMGNLLIGISGGSSQYRISYDQKAQSDTSAYHGNLYGTYGLERAYIDGGIAYGRNKVDTRTAEPFVLEGKFDADVASAYLGGGYDLIDVKGGTVFTPEASVQYSMYKQDRYTETSTVAIPRVIDEFEAESLLGTVGMNITMLKTMKLDTFGLKVDGRVHWMHEFNPDPSNLNFMLEGGSTPYQLSYPGLDEDVYRIGIGGTFFNTIRYQPKNVMLRLDFDELFCDGFNSHNLSAKLIYAF